MLDLLILVLTRMLFIISIIFLIIFLFGISDHTNHDGYCAIQQIKHSVMDYPVDSEFQYCFQNKH